MDLPKEIRLMVYERIPVTTQKLKFDFQPTPVVDPLSAMTMVDEPIEQTKAKRKRVNQRMARQRRANQQGTPPSAHRQGLSFLNRTVSLDILRACKVINYEAAPMMSAKLDEIRSQPLQIVMRALENNATDGWRQVICLFRVFECFFAVANHNSRFPNDADVSPLVERILNNSVFCRFPNRDQLLQAMKRIANKFCHHIRYRQTLDGPNKQYRLPVIIDLTVTACRTGRMGATGDVSLIRRYMHRLVGTLQSICSNFDSRADRLIVVLRPQQDTFGAVSKLHPRDAQWLQDEINAAFAGVRHIIMGDVIQADEIKENYTPDQDGHHF